ncbi:MAG: potassium transporter Kup [Archangium gephyra]|uniref:Probable potassium transport system protein Kup n=1 Tax=Archangium gephyra TaxID=48 RepID=A0A2W5SYP6_9BACT|nr:MAG: potassium transporter Kup [Archangium gephyra]
MSDGKSAEGAAAGQSKEPDPGSPAPAHHGHSKGSLAALTVGALGIVFGDIGTSPLYTMAECFAKDAKGAVKHHALEVTDANVMGLLSLIFWALMLVVTVKYIQFIMRADNKGEGGMFSMLALVPQTVSARVRAFLVLSALFGSALLYGDGIITPAISVLSAVEGLGVATHAMDRFVVPITLVIIFGLFLIQKRGTDMIGKAFGPVMITWFVVLGVLGVISIVSRPEVLKAIDPRYAIALFQADAHRAFLVLGGVVLCITGGEALYADMGHFGTRPIRLSWYAVVMPSLLLNYFGQGAALLNEGWVEKPFWALVPPMFLYPMVVLSTAAAIIASQAMISGAFSLTRQAVQLGFMPRVTIVHTSAVNEGQIYIPEVNNLMMVACLALVLAFRESSALAAAYGIAVTGTMTITSILFAVVMYRRWKWNLAPVILVTTLFLAFDLPFLAANAVKFFDGGWFPIAIGVCLFALMTTWKTGRAELARRFNKSLMPLTALLEDLESTKPHRVRGTAVFMAGNPDGTPPVMLHHLKHNQVLHRQVVLLSILPQEYPHVPREEQIEVEDLGQGFFRVMWKTGFMETPNVPNILLRAREHGLVCEPSTTSYFLGRETLLTNGKAPMMVWRKLLFAFVSRNALSATSYFGLPPGRVVELGMQVDL